MIKDNGIDFLRNCGITKGCFILYFLYTGSLANSRWSLHHCFSNCRIDVLYRSIYDLVFWHSPVPISVLTSHITSLPNQVSQTVTILSWSSLASAYSLSLGIKVSLNGAGQAVGPSCRR